MDGGEFDEALFFRSIFGSETRVLLIGRQALIALGLPVLTADYDLWVHFDDVERLNLSLAPLEFVPTRSPDEARRSGRYALENSEHVDVLLARVASTVHGVHVAFDDLWERRQSVDFGEGVRVQLPAIDDLIATKLSKRQQLRPEIAAIHDRLLSPDEVAQFLATPISDEEVESTKELVLWFTRRYPTARERFAYNRRAYARAVARPTLRKPV